MTRTIWICLLLAATARAGDTLIGNGGFESRLDKWFWISGSHRAEISFERARKGGGKRALHITKAGGFPADVLGQSFDIPENMRHGRFTVSAVIKAKASVNAWLKFYLYDAKGDVVVDEVDITQVRGTFSWKKFERVFKIPAGAVRGKVLLQVFLGGEIWIDDVAVEWSGKGGKKKRKQAKPIAVHIKTWLDKNAVAVRGVEIDGPLTDLAPLQKTLEGVRIVQLGENTHGDGTCFSAKARLIRWLHEKLGFDVLAFECGFWECDRANEHLKPGANPMDAMKAGIFKIWHTRRTKTTFEYLVKCAETKKPITLAGYDPQQSTESARRFVPQFLRFLQQADVDIGAVGDALSDLDAEIRKSEYANADPGGAIALLAGMRRLFDDNRKKIEEKHGARETAFWRRAFDNYAVHEQLRRTRDDTAYFNLRDEWMGRNLIWLADERFKGRKIIVWAATRHIAHNMKTIRDRGRSMYSDTKCMGEYVHEHFGKQCYTIGFAAHGGRAGRWFLPKFDVPAPSSRSLEELFFRYGKPYLFVDLRRKHPFGVPLHLSVLAYSRGFTAKWGAVIDGVFYIEEMAPAVYMGD